MEATPYNRIGVIDLGTNSVRFDVHQIERDGSANLLHREKLMVRLGENLFVDGKLDGRAVKRTVEAFSSFKVTADSLRVNKVVAFATSAVREARDGSDFVKAIRTATGIEVQIIAGREEARLIAAGILAHRGDLKGTQALVDIGGGSTEITVVVDGKIIRSQSFPLGVARVQQVFLKSSPPTPEAVAAARAHIRQVLAEVLEKERWPKVERIVGSSGTIRALHRIAKKNYGKLNRDNLKEITKGIVKMTPEQLEKIPGIEPKRIDLVAAGSVLLEQIMIGLRAKKATVTAYSLRDGILQQVIRQNAPTTYSVPRGDLNPLYARAVSFGENKAHLKRLVGVAELLFDRLKPLHKLEARWRSYLVMAVILRTTGKAISPVNYEKHSYYIVTNTDLPVTDAWEIELVARLCLHQEEGKLGELTFVGGEKKDAFEKLLAILRIVDALDPAYRDRMMQKQIRIHPEKVLLRLSKGRRMELALLRLQQKKALFEKVFSRVLTAETTH